MNLTTSKIITSKCFKYAEDVASGVIVASQKNILAAKRFLNDLEKSKSKGFKWKFDIEKAYRPIEFKERFMVPTKGDYSRMELLPWQHFTTGNMFGWVDKKTELRRFREALVCVGRGNGKTTDLSGTALYGASKDGEKGADVYLLANAKEQSKILFDEVAANCGEGTKLGKHFRTTLAAIFYDPTNSKIQHRASDSRKLDGLNTHVGIFDEIHEFQDFKLISVIKRSTNKRKQPLIIYITTMGTRLDGALIQLYDVASKVLTTPELVDEDVRDRFFAYIAELDKDDDVDDTSKWIKANPSLGKLLSLETLENDWKRAKMVPQERSDFINKQLNIFTQADEMSFLDYEVLKRNCDSIDLKDLHGMECYAGYDASMSEDFSATALEFPLPDGRTYFLHHSWVTTKKIEADNEKIPYRDWEKAGYLTIVKGEYIPKEAIRDWFIEMSQLYSIRGGGFDPAYSYGIVPDLQAEGINLNPVRQGFLTLSEPIQNLKEMFLDGKVVTNNDLMLRWYINNVKMVEDRNGNRMPTKQNRYRKIDGFAAMITAHSEYMRMNPNSLTGNEQIVTVINTNIMKRR